MGTDTSVALYKIDVGCIPLVTMRTPTMLLLHCATSECGHHHKICLERIHWILLCSKFQVGMKNLNVEFFLPFHELTLYIKIRAPFYNNDTIYFLFIILITLTNSFSDNTCIKKSRNTLDFSFNYDNRVKHFRRRVFFLSVLNKHMFTCELTSLSDKSLDWIKVSSRSILSQSICSICGRKVSIRWLHDIYCIFF